MSKIKIVALIIKLITTCSLSFIPLLSEADEPLSCRDIPTLNFSARHRASFEDGIIRCEQQCYYIPLKAGETLDITLKDNNDYSAITVYKPGVRIEYGTGNIEDDKPFNDYIGESLKSTPRGGTTRHSRERVDVSGHYLLVVALARGGASAFKGTVRVTP